MPITDDLATVARPAHPRRYGIQNIMDGLGPSVFVGLLMVDGSLLFANRSALNAADIKLEDVLGQPFDTTPWWGHSEAGRDQLRAAIRAAASGETCRFDAPVQVSGGRLITMDVTLHPVRNAAGQVSLLVPSGRDVSERDRAERDLRRTQTAVDRAHQAMLQVGPDARVLYANDAACKLVQHSREALLGMRLHDIHNQMTHTQWAVMWDQLRGRGALRTETIVRRTDGSELPVEVFMSHVVFGSDEYSLVCVEDITERYATRRRIAHLDHHDALTGLPNRRLLLQHLEAGARGAEVCGHALSVLYVDLDRFARINAALGHIRGDDVLQIAARRIASCMGLGDMLARVGGDEFVVVPAISAAPEAARERLAVSIREAMSEAIVFGVHEYFVTASIGIATARGEHIDGGSLLRDAGVALQRAKDRGRNLHHVYAVERGDDDPDRVPLEGALRHALQRGELTLNYQPQVDLSSGAIVGVEALLRWHSPRFGTVAPDRFIPIAEETGLIVPIGEWVLRTAASTAAAWQRAGLPPIRTLVNLSGRQLQQPDLVGRIEAILAETGLDPQRFGIELTESMLMGQVEVAAEMLGRMRALGLEISLDDFGTGYSSLS
ncbi:MAG: hypothetical protein JWP52_3662, partial [Rhizobacter sp.]|nr:hypothetical protein [Rhizobacter sp.]